MKTPSRFLFSPRPARVTPVGWLILVGLSGAALYWIYRMIVGFMHDGEPFIFFFSAFLAWFIVFTVQDNRQLMAQHRALADARRGKSICDFARSFNLREVDTWVIRAVWNVLSESVNREGPDGFIIPIFVDDRLADEFMLEDEDDLLDTLEDMAFRAGRSTELLGTDGFSGPLVTVRDAVLLLNALPMTGARKDRLWMTVKP
ncbi:hypothetical protein CHU32_09005 [Superficieibacter electus]|uniref:Uncharacterized protein n=1 Tax=Superficieibacter electus TaxID=2022662 RepID=A0A2P5GRR1_9ENTR|nr:hypothetical protein [Superficieibacter electus]POP45930.1 hypothetical protein CHU33_07460 [Superficieibacter electus]POP49237.1 hypothetical protein CHU32_09005 [Superficieibacter electus]